MTRLETFESGERILNAKDSTKVQETRAYPLEAFSIDEFDVAQTAEQRRRGGVCLERSCWRPKPTADRRGDRARPDGLATLLRHTATFKQFVDGCPQQLDACSRRKDRREADRLDWWWAERSAQGRSDIARGETPEAGFGGQRERERAQIAMQ